MTRLIRADIKLGFVPEHGSNSTSIGDVDRVAMLFFYKLQAMRTDFRVRIPENVVFCYVSGEAVALNTITSKYYGLDETGVRMWQLLAEHEQLDKTVAALLTEFDVDEARLRADVDRFVKELSECGLVEVVPS